MTVKVSDYSCERLGGIYSRNQTPKPNFDGDLILPITDL